MARIALLSDIHEDVVSLTKALRLMEREKCDTVVCLGDIAGYPYLRGKYETTRDLTACLKLIRQHCSVVVAGNHDLFHCRRLPQFSDGFSFPENWYSLSPDEMTRLSKGRVWNYSDDLPIECEEVWIQFLNNLPEYEIRAYGDLQILFSHFSFPNFSGLLSLKENERIKEHFSFMHENHCQVSICGHLHIEGTGIAYEPGDHFLSALVGGFSYYSFGERRIKARPACITIPALADNGQVNGFAVFDTIDRNIRAISLDTNRKFIL